MPDFDLYSSETLEADPDILAAAGYLQTIKRFIAHVTPHETPHCSETFETMEVKSIFLTRVNFIA